MSSLLGTVNFCVHIKTSNGMEVTCSSNVASEIMQKILDYIFKLNLHHVSF